MMRKFTTCLMICATWFFVSSCNDNDVSSPPKSNLAVDKTSGLANETEFTFTIDQAPGAASIALLPYGTANLSLGGIPVSSFTSGKATVKFKYAQVGTFDAVVVTNNHSADGKSVKNVYSNAITITITSGKNQISEFTFDKISTGTSIDQDAHTIAVDVPYGTDLTALKATFASDAFTKLSVGGAEQTSGTTANNFTNPVTYTVTADNGDTNTYEVTVTPAAINTTATFKSFTGKETSKVNAKTLGSALADTETDLILYDIYDSPVENYDSVQFSYELDNPFGALHLGTEVDKLHQDTRLDLTTAKTLKLLAQDSASVQHAFTLHIVNAPLLTLAKADADNTITSVNTNFTILVKALKGTVTNSTIPDVTFDIDEPSGVNVNSITFTDIDNPGGVTLSPGDSYNINFNDAVTIVLHVTDSNLGGISYDVTYTAGLTELK
jgi:hypothetical protein